MTFNQAQKLHLEDEVIVKATGQHSKVIQTREIRKNISQGIPHSYVEILLYDGNWYLHTELK